MVSVLLSLPTTTARESIEYEISLRGSGASRNTSLWASLHSSTTNLANDASSPKEFTYFAKNPPGFLLGSLTALRSWGQVCKRNVTAGRRTVASLYRLFGNNDSKAIVIGTPASRIEPRGLGMSECARFLPAKFTQRKHDMLHARRLLLRNLAQITPSSQISFTDDKQTLMGPKTKRGTRDN